MCPSGGPGSCDANKGTFNIDGPFGVQQRPKQICRLQLKSGEEYLDCATNPPDGIRTAPPYANPTFCTATTTMLFSQGYIRDNLQLAFTGIDATGSGGGDKNTAPQSDFKNLLATVEVVVTLPLTRSDGTPTTKADADAMADEMNQEPHLIEHIKRNLATLLASTSPHSIDYFLAMIQNVKVTVKASGRRSLNHVQGHAGYGSAYGPSFVFVYDYELRSKTNDIADVQSQVQTQLANTATVATQLKLTETVAAAAAATPALASTTLASATTAAAALTVTSPPTTATTAYTGTTYTEGKAKKLKKKCKNKKTWCSSVQKDSKGKCKSYQGTAARKIKKKFCKGHCKKRCVEFLASAQAASG